MEKILNVSVLFSLVALESLFFFFFLSGNFYSVHSVLSLVSAYPSFAFLYVIYFERCWCVDIYLQNILS